MRPASLLTLSLIPQATEGSVVNKAQISPAIGQRETLRHCWPRPVGPHPCPAVTLPLVPVSPAPVPQREAEGIILTRTSCRKITHKNGHSSAWPGWAVSVSLLPLNVSRSTRVALTSHVLSQTQAAEHTQPSPCLPRATPQRPSAPTAETAVTPEGVRGDHQALHGVPTVGRPGHKAPGT